MKIIDAHAHLVQCIAGTCGGGEMRACAAGGPARTAPEGLIPLDSLSPLRRELEWQSSLLHLALPAKRMAGRVGEYGKSFHSRVYIKSTDKCKSNIFTVRIRV